MSHDNWPEPQDDPGIIEFVASQAGECEQRFRGGHYPDVIRALLFCAANRVPIPEWVADEAELAMQFYFANGGSTGKGKTGTILTRHIRDKKHRKRHQIAQWELARRVIVGGTRADAFERAYQRLRGSFAAGVSADDIMRSYNKVQKLYRDPREPVL